MSQKEEFNPLLSKVSLGKIANPVPSVLSMLAELFDISRPASIGVCVMIVIVLVGSVIYFIKSAPPTTITITCGPEGSRYYTYATQYAELLKKQHVKLNILTSNGSQENLLRLKDPQFKVDVGFVQDVQEMGNPAAGGSPQNPSPATAGAIPGVESAAQFPDLVSLGSVAHQPLLVLYRGAPIHLLSELAGKRVSIGPEGSGTRTLALQLLALNEITLETAPNLLNLDPKDSCQGLIEGTLDAAFLMSEDSSAKLLHDILRTPGINIMSFSQAEAYTRKVEGLSVFKLPEGSIDFATNLPDHDIYLFGPDVELIARKNFHPALSDVLLEAAKVVHNSATILQRKGEFPYPYEHQIPISSDAARFYKSGSSFFYHYLPFWLASLASRFLVVVIPSLLVLYPILHNIPKIYRWRVQSQIYRWYRALLALERELTAERNSVERQILLERLGEVEKAVNRMKIPAFFLEQFYVLRGHIDYVRQLLSSKSEP